jgi:hypothetical protein
MAKTFQFVKTSISVPIQVCAPATGRAKELDTSRSTFFAIVVEKEPESANTSACVIERINEVVDAVNDNTREFASTAAFRQLEKDDGTQR